MINKKKYCYRINFENLPIIFFESGIVAKKILKNLNY